MTTNAVPAAAPVVSAIAASVITWLCRVVLVLPALLMVLISVRFIGNPTHAVASTGVALSTPEAWTDTRAVGALALTISFVLVMSIVSGRLRMGHATVIELMTFIIAVRMFGFAEDGTTLAMGNQKTKFVGEIVFLTLNALGFAAQTLLKRARMRQ